MINVKKTPWRGNMETFDKTRITNDRMSMIYESIANAVDEILIHVEAGTIHELDEYELKDVLISGKCLDSFILLDIYNRLGIIDLVCTGLQKEERDTEKYKGTVIKTLILTSTVSLTLGFNTIYHDLHDTSSMLLVSLSYIPLLIEAAYGIFHTIHKYSRDETSAYISGEKVLKYAKEIPLLINLIPRKDIEEIIYRLYEEGICVTDRYNEVYAYVCNLCKPLMMVWQYEECGGLSIYKEIIPTVIPTHNGEEQQVDFNLSEGFPTEHVEPTVTTTE